MMALPRGSCWEVRNLNILASSLILLQWTGVSLPLYIVMSAGPNSTLNGAGYNHLTILHFYHPPTHSVFSLAAVTKDFAAVVPLHFFLFGQV